MTTPAAQPPEPIDWRDLIATGRVTLIPQQPGTQPGTAALRRAVSTAYYAMFHALAASNADALMGTPNDELTTDARVQIYRGLNRNQARAQLQQNQARISANAQAFAKVFSELQGERHNADYNPLAPFNARAATSWLNKAETAITDFLQTSESEGAAIAILTLIRTR